MRSMAALSVALLATAASAQVVPAWWTPIAGPSGGGFGQVAAVDALGNVFAVGTITPVGSAFSQTVVAKHSAAGAPIWAVERDLLPLSEMISECSVSPSGGLYICGQSPFIGASPMLFLAEIDANGALLWTRTVTGSGNKAFTASFAVAPGGDLVLVGSLGNPAGDVDGVVARYSSSGAPLWTRWLDSGVGANEYANAVEVEAGGAVLAAGVNEASGNRDLAVWKLAANGSNLWSRALGGPNSDSGAVLALSRSGQVLVGGALATTDVFGAFDSEGLVVQLDSASGATIWQRTYGDASPGPDRVVDVAIDERGVRWIAGEHTSADGSRASRVRRYDAQGALLSSHEWALGSAIDPAGYTSTAPAHWLRGPAGQMWLAAISAAPDTAQAPLGRRCAVLQYSADGAFDWAGFQTSAPGKRIDSFVRAAFAPPARIVFAGQSIDLTTGVAQGFSAALDFTRMPHSYCAAKVTSNGCTPNMEISGMPSAALASGFVVRARNVRNQRSGHLFYGVSGPLSAPFKGGTMCVAPPLLRTPVQNSGGVVLPADDCSGVFELDLNAFARSPLANPALLAVGTTVCAQCWGRDPGFAAPDAVMLSNAVRYDVQP